MVYLHCKMAQSNLDHSYIQMASYMIHYCTQALEHICHIDDHAWVHKKMLTLANRQKYNYYKNIFQKIFLIPCKFSSWWDTLMPGWESFYYFLMPFVSTKVDSWLRSARVWSLDHPANMQFLKGFLKSFELSFNKPLFWTSHPTFSHKWTLFYLLRKLP